MVVVSVVIVVVAACFVSSVWCRFRLNTPRLHIFHRSVRSRGYRSTLGTKQVDLSTLVSVAAYRAATDLSARSGTDHEPSALDTQEFV